MGKNARKALQFMVSLVHAMMNAFGIPRSLHVHVGVNIMGALSKRVYLL